MNPRTVDARLSVALRLELADFALDVAFDSSARCLGIFGPSGSGKTSLLEALAGWRRGARGRITLGERTLLDTARGVDLALCERGIGYVPQDALLFPHWSVEQNLRVSRRAARAPTSGDARSFERAVETLGIAALLARPATSLSGGERQRVALARAILAEPALFLLDEPLGGVDVLLRRRILPWLVRLRDAAEAPIVFVSHDPTEVQVLCDEVLVLERGAVVARGAPAPTLRAWFAREERFENVLEGVVAHLGAGTARVDVGAGGMGGLGRLGVHVARGALELGERVAFALPSDDVLVAVRPVEGLSARNVLPGRVAALARGPQGVRVDLALGDGASVPLSATLTEEAVRELALEPGRAVFGVFKTSSCRVLAPEPGE